MVVLLNRLFACFASIICAVSGLLGAPDAEKITARQYEIPGSVSCEVANGRVSINAPSIVQAEDGTFYVFFYFIGNCVSIKQKIIVCLSERPFRVLGDGLIENGHRGTAKPFSCII